MNDELIKNLREAASFSAALAVVFPHAEGKGMVALLNNAADAIEELQQIARHYEQKSKDYWKECCEYREQITLLVKKQEVLFEPALKFLELSNRPYIFEAPQPPKEET